MTLFFITPLMLKRAKQRLRPMFPSVKSSHLSEVMAAALGYKTHAAVLKYAEAFVPGEDFMEVIGINEGSFYERLKSFGASFAEAPTGSLFEQPVHPHYLPPLFNGDGFDTNYVRPKAKAWHNLMVAAINAGLEQGLFSLHKGDNRWSETDPYKGHVYRFSLAGHPSLCCVKDAGGGVLSFHAVVFPEPDAEQWLFLPQLGLSGGEAYGMAWLERDGEARLAAAMGFFKARKNALLILKEAENISPQGYRDQ